MASRGLCWSHSFKKERFCCTATTTSVPLLLSVLTPALHDSHRRRWSSEHNLLQTAYVAVSKGASCGSLHAALHLSNAHASMGLLAFSLVQSLAQPPSSEGCWLRVEAAMTATAPAAQQTWGCQQEKGRSQQ